LKEFDRALQLDPSLMEAYINLGILYKERGDYARARSYFETFLAKAPGTQHTGSIPQVKKELTWVMEKQAQQRPQAR
jgi:tetratricopeptide (TPR) repeat protein